MGASFARFLRTGQLGPLTLGMDPSTVELELGLPEERSRKHNPLVLKYGPLELTFWSPRPQPLQLAQVRLSVIHDMRGLPRVLRFDDWTVDPTMQLEDFIGLVTRIAIRPEEVRRGDLESSIVLPSGVIASFMNGQLRALVLSKREREEGRPPFLTDEREPSVEQIRFQLLEAREALRHGLRSAAVLLAWAALEAVLRRSAVHAGYKGKLRVAPTILIRELYARGILNSEQFRVVETARQQRTIIAHGLVSASVDPKAVLQIIGLSEHLLSGLSGPSWSA